jgi:hypothetical protein
MDGVSPLVMDSNLNNLIIDAGFFKVNLHYLFIGWTNYGQLTKFGYKISRQLLQFAAECYDGNTTVFCPEE